MSDDPRSAEQLREHYEVERELADRLRHASKEARRHLYSAVYEELFTRVPHHAQLRRRDVGEETRMAVAHQMAFLMQFLDPQTVFLEIGAGDCALSRAVAGMVGRVYAVDVSATITQGTNSPENLEIMLSDGISLPVPRTSVDLAYSNQLMEHLHPDDAREQLQNVYEALKPGGRYVCITPHRLSGPHDISRHFDRVATGFHLKEYTPGELARLLRRAGFRRVRVYLGGRGHYLAFWPALLSLVELPFTLLPRATRVAIGLRAHLGFLRAIRIVATK
jgi:SAM-dependent methyltransferase